MGARELGERAWVSAVIAAVAIPVVLIVRSPSAKLFAGVYGAAFVGAALILGVVFRGKAREDSEELTEARNELDLLTMDEDQPEQRAQKLLQVNQFDLKRYYDQTLRQGQNIFYVGVACIFVGFAVIGVTFLLVTDHVGHALSTRIIIGALGAVGGVLANFIAVVFLRMYSTTIRSVATFHNRLVGTHDLYFGNLLAAMVDDREMRYATVAKICSANCVDATSHHQFGT